MKKCAKLWKSVKNSETILPVSCCPLSFSLMVVVHREEESIHHHRENPLSSGSRPL